MSSDLVNLFRVSRTFESGSGTVTALNTISCVVTQGEHVALVGPSGSGKTTLLALMAGLEKPDTGEVNWPSLQTPLRPQRIGMAYQGASLLPSLTVAENVGAPLLIADDPSLHPTKISEMLTSLGLAGLESRYPDQLSGGQAQRVVLARAMVMRPALLLADEPTGHLDQNTGKAIMATLFNWARMQGVTLVVATHDPAVAKRFDHVWRLDHGEMTKDTE